MALSGVLADVFRLLPHIFGLYAVAWYSWLRESSGEEGEAARVRATPTEVASEPPLQLGLTLDEVKAIIVRRGQLVHPLELLERAKKLVWKQEGRQEEPEWYAFIHQGCTVVVNELDYASGRQLMEQGLSAARHMPMGRPRQRAIALSLSAIGWLHASLEMFELAQQIYMEAMNTWAGAISKSDQLTTCFIMNLAIICLAMDKFELAEQLFFRACVRALEAADDKASHDALIGAAGALMQKGDFGRAEKALRRVLSMMREHPSSADGPNMLCALFDLECACLQRSHVSGLSSSNGSGTASRTSDPKRQELHSATSMQDAAEAGRKRQEGGVGVGQDVVVASAAASGKVQGSSCAGGVQENLARFEDGHFGSMYAGVLYGNGDVESGDGGGVADLVAGEDNVGLVQSRLIKGFESFVRLVVGEGGEEAEMGMLLASLADVRKDEGFLVHAEYLYKRAAGCLLAAKSAPSPTASNAKSVSPSDDHKMTRQQKEGNVSCFELQYAVSLREWGEIWRIRGEAEGDKEALGVAAEKIEESVEVFQRLAERMSAAEDLWRSSERHKLELPLLEALIRDDDHAGGDEGVDSEREAATGEASAHGHERAVTLRSVWLGLAAALACQGRLASTSGKASVADALLRRAREVSLLAVYETKKDADRESAEIALLQVLGVHMHILTKCGWASGRAAVEEEVRLLEGRLGVTIEVT